MRTVEHIVVTGDFLRPVDREFRPSQNENIRWLHRLLRGHVERASGLPVRHLAWGEGLDPLPFYEAFGAEFSAAGWASFFAAEAVPPEVLEALENRFGRALVIGFELAEWCKAALSHLGIAFVDLSIHPVRFLPDVFFAAQTNDPEIFAALLPHHSDPDGFYGWADLLSATAVKFAPELKLESALLLVGQTRVDRSLVRGGELLDLSHFAPELQALQQRHRAFCFKPHPYGSGDFGLFTAGVPFRRVQMLKANAYAALAQDGLREVVGISSSLLVEAPYFGKSATFLHRSPFDLAGAPGMAREGQHLSLVDRVLDADFWRDILAPRLPVTAPDGRRFVLPPNTLRISLRNFWGFNELSSDFVVQLYQSGAAARR
ncbi:hypothetical protein NON00_07110 [Roseomonas sp. GC11]|uniref:hypothetical protein n=1 Tax=Roseomonas sp. GC11 TaxID=2950546 RepID=UPI00210873AB|nr:hypothetical protein [Roseomonas sp. GC11]MCQ4159693.1 hypothetical protein [Roseomonas sp. GC11]